MQTIECLNLCDILIKDCKIVKNKYERIYVGSYFCAEFFMHMGIEELGIFIGSQSSKITLVVPIFSQKNLEAGKEKITHIILKYYDKIDEITVNDYGMLDYVSNSFNICINMGRLFMKDYRDPRYEDYFRSTNSPRIFTEYLDKIISKYKVKGMEFDPTHSKIDFASKPDNMVIAVHTPYAYMTTGKICEYASTNTHIDKKFRPNKSCEVECANTRIHYEITDTMDWIRIGRTIFFENRKCELINLEKARLIYFPVDSEVQK